jgi:anaerobic magnesium-protoporphyrin IX monomethyl ester cyclase
MNNPARKEMQIGKLDVLFVMPPHYRLVNESFFSFPLGLGYLVSYLNQKKVVSAIFNMETMKQKGYFNRLIDGLNPRKKYIWYRYATKWDIYYKRIEDLNDPIWAEIAIVLRQTNPKIIGITASIINLPCAFNIAKIVKESDPNLKIVLGGPAASTIPDAVIDNENVDFIVYGEGEETMAELTEHILNGRTSPELLQNVKGIMFKNGKEIVKTSSRSLITNINKLPFPDRECMFDLDEKNQLRKVYSNGDILTSRGCPYLCKFCACYAVWGTHKPRVRSVDNITREIEQVMAMYGEKLFILWDDLFTINKKRVIEFCEYLIRKNLNIQWICLARLNTIDKELIEIMKKAGCIQIQVGVESGNERMLKFIGKNLTLSMIKEKTRILNDVGMNWLAFFIIGFPTETKEEIGQTLNFIEEIKPSVVQISMFSPYPGSEFFVILKENDILKKTKYMKYDTSFTEKNYTCTMSDSEFKEIALKALKIGDRYNRKQKPTFPIRLCRRAHCMASKAFHSVHLKKMMKGLTYKKVS